MDLQKLLDQPIGLAPGEIKVISELSKLLLAHDSTNENISIIIPTDLSVPMSMVIAAGLEALTPDKDQSTEGKTNKY